MRILIEGEIYPFDTLGSIFGDHKFYRNTESGGQITSVGYYHSFENNELVFMLPKVFMEDDTHTVFERNIEDLLNFETSSTIHLSQEDRWIRQLTINLYNSLVQFRRRNPKTVILNSNSSNHF